MTRDAPELAAQLDEATAPQFRNRLLSGGQAQSMIRRDGIFPDDSPRFSLFLDQDLLDYGYGLASTGLRLLDALSDEQDGENETGDSLASAQNGFIQASFAIEAATRNAGANRDITFHRLLAGAMSHLGGYAARAYSLVQSSIRSGQLTPIERTLADLLLRDLGAIDARTVRFTRSPNLTDQALVASMSGTEGRPVDVDPESVAMEDDSASWGSVMLLLTEHYLTAVSSGLFALSLNLGGVLSAAQNDLQEGEQAALEIAVPGPWWVYRVTRRLMDDLGRTNIRRNIPRSRPPAATPPNVAVSPLPSEWGSLRNNYVATLFSRNRSELDLWPSQMHVVNRVFDSVGDLVVALPTSAGKTRIAELCILACLAQGRRVVYVTPLRALSAQTERILDRTFSPLGVSVSSLYGSMGASVIDDDTLRTSRIVIATPEKLDFALRSDPSVIDDVGLVILDEGHMIGPAEREVRYEAQVQRLLRRSDANTRRIVCLSAVFPSGTELDDFVAWITDDDPQGLHKEDWRPTRQLFGLVEWRSGDHARLTMTVGEDQPFIPRYIEARVPTSPRRTTFPKNQRELMVATAWRLVEEGQTVLIFCPQRNSVEPYAAEVLALHRQNLIESILPDEADVTEALAIGAEWFGAEHPIVRCLQIGVAIHHGALPGPFRRQIEQLLHDKVIKVTVASPTLAQGLNLSASAVLFHGLRRAGILMNGAEFANVIGRAGRAFVDTEGLVLYPIFEPNAQRARNKRRDWIKLTNGAPDKTLRSGLISIGIELIRRMHQTSGSVQLVPQFLDYLTGDPGWTLPVIVGETMTTSHDAEQKWFDSLARLDLSILSMLGEDDADPDEVTQLVADALRDSLWERQLRRFTQLQASVLRELIYSRARHIWRTSSAQQRRGWYLAGLGSNAGTELAGIAPLVVNLIARAELEIGTGALDLATETIIDIATQVFNSRQFEPQTKLDWQPVLVQWLSGSPLGTLPNDRVEIAQFIESDLTYLLVWGIEASRVYETAQGNLQAFDLTGAVVTAIETGTLSLPASILIKSGFDHRSAALTAVTETGADFDTAWGMRLWIEDLPPDLRDSAEWPSVESRSAWLDFTNRANSTARSPWTAHTWRVDKVTWYGERPAAGDWLRITRVDADTIEIRSPGLRLLGEAAARISSGFVGRLHARKDEDAATITLRYRGPDDLITAD